MLQKSLLDDEPAMETGKRVRVLVPFPVAKAYDYALPDDIAAGPGDYVRVTLGRKETPGVVWAAAGDPALDPSKIKPVLRRYDAPPLPEAHRKFIDRVAAYTMSDPGAVLKMTLSAPDALDPPKTVPAYVLPANAPPSQKLSAHRKKVAEILSDGIPRKAADIARAASCSPAIIRAMAGAGQLVPAAVKDAAPGAIRLVPVSKLQFSDAQQAAAETLARTVAKGGYSATLLDGVTGSGKTEVYFEAVAEALKKGKQVLVLLPEIALSAQFLKRFTRRFGSAPAIWHSEVSPARRRAVWAGAASGETKVVMGARSALFLPFADLGLVVVDEEHDSSYKQEEGVMYNARDMAVLRASLGEFPVLLVSATPSLETTENARSARYGYLHLPARHAGAKLPDMHVIDLKAEPPERGRFMAPSLVRAITETLAAGEQALLFLNRRGYAPLTLCRTCGHRFQCPSCSAWLVEHKRHGTLQCHHCAYARKLPKDCPSCQDAGNFAACGPGVERIEEEVRQLFPEARPMVLASDLMTSPGMIADTVRAIEDRRADIVIGTQIVAKGHHFPSLTLVGVIDADLGLAGGDLRAGERTFQLLHQVAGRAGRGDRPGRVFLQTYMPQQPVLKALAANDRDRFLSAESAERERAGMPPFGRLAGVIVSGADEAKLEAFCRALGQRAPRYDDVRVLGPAPAPMAFLRGRHRRRFLVKTGRGVALQKYVGEWLSPVRVPSGIQLKVDIDPQSFF